MLSVPNSALGFGNVWNASADNSSLTFSGVSMAGQKYNVLSAKIIYSFINIITLSVNLTYVQLWTINNNFPSSSFIRNYLTTSQVYVDLSGTVSSDPVNFPNLTFSV